MLLSGGTLTICNTGALATGGHGTALGMVRSALELGTDIHLYACETRPYNQVGISFIEFKLGQSVKSKV